MTFLEEARAELRQIEIDCGLIPMEREVERSPRHRRIWLLPVVVSVLVVLGLGASRVALPETTVPKAGTTDLCDPHVSPGAGQHWLEIYQLQHCPQYERVRMSYPQYEPQDESSPVSVPPR